MLAAPAYGDDVVCFDAFSGAALGAGAGIDACEVLIRDDVDAIGFHTDITAGPTSAFTGTTALGPVVPLHIHADVLPSLSVP